MPTPVFYRRNLPHWQPPEETFFVTFRLAGSLPISVIAELKDEYLRQIQDPNNQAPEKKWEAREKYFHAFENQLDKSLNGPYWLNEQEIAKIVMDSLHFNDKKLYDLIAGCIMSNHVHVLMRLLAVAPTLNVILQNIKKFTAVQSNKLLSRSGKFWAEESFDILIRNEKHFYNTIHYIINNPVKAGLVNNWWEWNWTYLCEELAGEYKLGEKTLDNK